MEPAANPLYCIYLLHQGHQAFPLQAYRHFHILQFLTFRLSGISAFCNFWHFRFVAFLHSAIFGISAFCNFWQVFPLLAISGISATSRLSMAMEILTGSLFISFHDWIGSMCMWCGVAMVLLFHSTTVALSALLCHCFSVSIDASHCLLCHMRERFDCSAF